MDHIGVIAACIPDHTKKHRFNFEVQGHLDYPLLPVILAQDSQKGNQAIHSFLADLHDGVPCACHDIVKQAAIRNDKAVLKRV